MAYVRASGAKRPSPCLHRTPPARIASHSGGARAASNCWSGMRLLWGRRALQPGAASFVPMGRMLCATGTTATTSEPRRDPARGAAVHNAPAIPAPATTPPPQPGAPHRRRRHNWVARRRKSCEARRARRR
ncbi:hypothetical protein L916_06902 [Phytophthora nicotianae]|uniref:Uncharacterized protein n=1 Tax=Phytophthora nicotianae TaxID=4792 RepID=W2J7A0_PHYNI|nr:hypothetical protein L916_06902 [Phytophthora nicotianae]